MLRYSYLISILFTAFCAGCSSGGGSDQAGPADPVPPSQPDPVTYPDVVYEGIQTPALITPGSVPIIISALGAFDGQIIDSAGAGITGYPVPAAGARVGIVAYQKTASNTVVAAVGVAPQARVNETESCAQGGTLTLAGELSSPSQGVFRITFNDCQLGELTYNGAGSYTIYQMSDPQAGPSDYAYDFEYLKLVSESVDLRLDGRLRTTLTSTRETITQDLVLEDLRAGRIFRYQNFKFVKSINPEGSQGYIEESINGAVAISDLGLVNFSTPTAIRSFEDSIPERGELMAQGAAGHYFLLDFSKRDVYVYAGEAEHHFPVTPSELADLESLNLQDSDSDGIHDSFEQATGLNPQVSDSGANLDDDLFSNFEEYQRQTDLTDPNSPLAPEIKLELEILAAEAPGEPKYSWVHTPGGITSDDGAEMVKLLPGHEYNIALSTTWFDFISDQQTTIEKLSLSFALPELFEVLEVQAPLANCNFVNDLLECVFETPLTQANTTLSALIWQPLKVRVKTKTDARGPAAIAAEVNGFFTSDVTRFTQDYFVGLSLSPYQQQIDALADDGEMTSLVIAPETYWGSLYIDKPVALQGEQGGVKAQIYGGSISLLDNQAGLSGFELFNGVSVQANAPFDPQYPLGPGVKGNIFHNASVGCSEGAMHVDSNWFIANTEVAVGGQCMLRTTNNIFMSSSAQARASVQPVNDIYFLNNVFDGVYIDVHNFGHLTYDGSVTIANNIFLNQPIAVKWPQGNPELTTIEYNSFWSPGAFPDDSQSPADTNLFEPVLFETASGDYRVSPGSPLIDAGHPEFHPQTDINGHHRPADGNGDGQARTDIGVHERLP